MTTESSDNPTWERETLEKVLLLTLKEQRRKRRWGVFFKLLTFIFLFAVLWLIWPNNELNSAGRVKEHTALVNLEGTIGSNEAASAANINRSLEIAFKDKNTKGIILNINSGGGAPVQAAYIYDQIRYLRGQHKNIKVYAVCSDLCASAAYLIASAADDIYADPASLVGSIGAKLDDFGFVGAMQKVGVERRLIASGTHKGFLDPFLPMKPDEEQYAQQLLDNVHAQFIQYVIKGRGNRLKQNPDLFSGLVWSGQQALSLGLIDGFGNIKSIARTVVKNEDIVDYTIKPSLFDELSGNMNTAFDHLIGSRLSLKTIRE